MSTTSTTTKTEILKNSDATKDSGRVKIGSGGINFADPRNTTKDPGRVRIGSGGIVF